MGRAGRTVMMAWVLAGCWSAPEPTVQAVSLTAPWTADALPVGEGTVRWSDATQLTVAYADGTVEDLTARYGDHLAARGFTLDGDLSIEGISSRTYVLDERMLVLSVRRDGDLLVNLSEL